MPVRQLRVPHPWRSLFRAGTTTVVVVLCAVCLLFYVQLTVYMVQRLHMNDFGKFYYSARLFLDGQDMYGPSPATEIPVSQTETRQFLNMNPPHFHLLILPFALLTPTNAFLLWLTVNLAALCLSLRAIARELQLHWTPARLIWTAAAVILCSATGTIAATGQLTFLLLLPITLAWIAARHNNWNRAAAYLGVCASIKPFLGIFLIYLVLRRDRKPAAFMVGAGAACVIVGLAVFGWTAYERWLAALSAVEWTWASMNGSVAALVSRAFSENPFYTPVVIAPWMITPVTSVLVFLIGVVFLHLLRQSPPRFVDHIFAGLLLTAQLVSPLGWIYYLWFIAGPAAAVYMSWKSHASRLRDTLALLAIPGLVVPFLVIIIEIPASRWAGLTLGSIYMWTTLFLWGSLMIDWRLRTRMPAAYPAPTATPTAFLIV